MEALGALTGSSGSSSTTSDANSALGDNYELFLTLLTTQLRNQDPLDPADPSEFTNQLVQYSSVEQSILANKNLEELIATVSSNEAYSMVNYIGTEVTALGNTTQLKDGNASWIYDAPSDASEAKIEIYNSAGALVHSDTTDLSKGSHTYTWDGTTSGGADAPDGSYTIKFTAEDADGDPLNVTSEITGVVSEVDLSSGTPFLVIGDTRIPIAAVTKIATPPAV